MKKFLFTASLLLCSASLLLWSGCSSDDGGGEEGPPANVDSLVAAANEALEIALYNLINGPDPQEPGDIDLSQPYNLYVDILRASPDNPTANFGAGVLEVMMITRDPDVQALYDRLQTFIESETYFEVPGGTGPLGSPLQPPQPVLRTGDLVLPAFAPLAIARRMTHHSLDDDPQFSEVQNFCVNELMPRMQTAINRLNSVRANANFNFIVTPRMQGDPLEDPVEIDLTEVYLTLAALDGSYALLSQICAYNMDFNAYDGPGMLAAFAQGSSFAALRSGGDQHMNNARARWDDALGFLSNGIDFLETESDYQGDDVIRIDPYDTPTQRDIDTLKHYLPLVLNALRGAQTFEFDTDNDDGTPPELITISLQDFFNSPVQDIKQLFPAYTVTLDTQAVDTYWNWDTRYVSTQVSIPADNYYYWYRYANYEYGELTYHYESRPFDALVWDQAFEAKAAELANSPYAYLSITYSGTLEQGTQTLEAYLFWGFDEVLRSRYTPRITWAASNFSQWVLPDPTVSGLLPGMTDARFKDIFGMTAEGWEQTSTWYLW